LLTSPRFAVRKIDVTGAQRRTAQDVARAGGLEIGANVFALDLESVRGRIAQDPWIESATVTRKLPSTIQIAVVEREPRAVVAISGELYLATRDGELFKKLGDREPADLPVVTGIDAQRVAKDRPGAVLAVRRALDVAEDMDRAGITKTAPIQEMSLQSDGSLVVFVGRDGLALALGRPPHRDKIDRIKSVLWELTRRKANASVIFADNETNPDRVVVRMK
jgi:cell division protein FtsQ